MNGRRLPRTAGDAAQWNCCQLSSAVTDLQRDLSNDWIEPYASKQFSN